MSEESLHKKPQDLGTLLKKGRTKKRLSLEKISKKTRINVTYLKAIENNQFDFLHRPYVLAFVKSYARILGLDVDEIKEKFNQQIRTQLETTPAEKEQQKPAQPALEQESIQVSPGISFGDTQEAGKSRKTVTVIVALALFFLLIIILQKWLVKTEENIITTPREIQIQDRFSSSGIVSVPKSQQQPAELTLRLVTGERLWFLIIIDDGLPSEYMFYPEESYSWNAEEKFQIRAGKSTGFDLFLNGRQLHNLGTEKTMIGNLVLTHDGVTELRILTRTEIQPQDTISQNSFRQENEW